MSNDLDPNEPHAAARGDQINVHQIEGSTGVAIGPGARAEVTVVLPQPSRPGSAPPLPALIVGREDTLRELKARLGLSADQPRAPQVLTAIRGWPGIGKTTTAAALAHDQEIAAAFSDGILWASLGQRPSVMALLDQWGRALGIDDLIRSPSVDAASARLRGMLRDQARLLIIDDVWEVAHAQPFLVGGTRCATLVTTREQGLARALAPTPNDIYLLRVLSDDAALELLQRLAPTVVQHHPTESLRLVQALEGLPLALQVAGHLLNAEASFGFGVGDLLKELEEGKALLEAQAPADRTELATQTTPTIAALLKHSTDRLDAPTRDCFAYLGAFAPKPATFDLKAMQAVWQVADAKPTLRTLLDRGLLEYIEGTQRYQMHALLVVHARSLLED